MIVSERRRRLDAHRAINDLEPGDFARRRGHRGVGFIESVSEGFAWIAWKDGRKDYLRSSLYGGFVRAATRWTAAGGSRDA